MKIIIAGGRDFNDYELLKEKCDKIVSGLTSVEIVSGMARGADALGVRYAKERDFVYHPFPADWNTQGKRAGMLRNIDMAKFSDGLIAFWDGKSKGTKHMIETAEEMGLKIRTVIYNI